MTGINPCTVAEAGPIVARAMGMSWTDNRESVMEYVNKVRNEWYNLYASRKLFFDVYHCICVSCFSEPCGTGDCSTGNYFGFSLPTDVDSFESIFESGVPLTMRSEWRESAVGLGAHGRFLETVLMSQKFVTERDPTPGARLKVYAESIEDTGKTVVFKVKSNGRDEVLHFKLQGEGWAFVNKPVDRIESIVLPGDRHGEIKIAEDQKDGSLRVLSAYNPYVSVPFFRRYKIQQPCSASAVLIKGVKKYEKVWCDTDIVEIGDELTIEATAKIFKFGENTTDAKEIRTSQYWRSEMNRNLDGIVARQRGGAIQDGTLDRGRPVTKRTTMPGYGARRRRLF